MFPDSSAWNLVNLCNLTLEIEATVVLETKETFETTLHHSNPLAKELVEYLVFHNGHSPATWVGNSRNETQNMIFFDGVVVIIWVAFGILG
jgi:hypothetical protein